MDIRPRQRRSQLCGAVCGLLAIGGMAAGLCAALRAARADDKPAEVLKRVVDRAESKAAAAESSDHKIDLADGKISLTAPASWVRKTPRVRFIDYEFAVPAAKGDPQDGRVTVMGAGGSVEANIDRWIGQFKQPNGSETKNRVADAEQKQKVAGVEVRMIDLAGSYHDMPAPFDPSSKAVDRADYRMLAAIVVAQKLGNYFIKFYGPKQTVSDHAEEFHRMIAGLQVK